jgi:ferrous iron transport protein B
MSSVETAPPESKIEASQALHSTIETQSHLSTVCLAGAPNAGKTALMNALTGGSFHTANYPGVTVTLSRGKSKSEFGPQVLLVDLPGVHSTSAVSPEEELSCRVIEGRHHSVIPEVLVVAVDATQLERHLKLASFVARQDKPTVIALTMMDLLARARQTVNVRKLEAALGVPVVPVDGRTGWGAAELMSVVHSALARKMNERSALGNLSLEPVAAYAEIRALLTRSEALRNENPFILADDSFTARVDRIVLHRIFGFPIFFAVLVGLFSSIFWVARPFMDLIDWSFKQTSHLLLATLPEGALSHFLAEGVVGGVGAVAVFFPQIVILFFLFSLLED